MASSNRVYIVTYYLYGGEGEQVVACFHDKERATVWVAGRRDPSCYRVDPFSTEEWVDPEFDTGYFAGKAARR